MKICRKGRNAFCNYVLFVLHPPSYYYISISGAILTEIIGAKPLLSPDDFLFLSQTNKQTHKQRENHLKFRIFFLSKLTNYKSSSFSAPVHWAAELTGRLAWPIKVVPPTGLAGWLVQGKAVS